MNIFKKAKEQKLTRKIFLQMILILIFTLIFDLLIVSLIQGKWRFWFPQWIDPDWQLNPYVDYSQSYFVGIVFIIPLFIIFDLEFFYGKKIWKRIILYGLMCILLSLILLWKGTLMIRFDKTREDIAWLLFAALSWVFLISSNIINKKNQIVEIKSFWMFWILIIGIILLILAIVDFILITSSVGLTVDLMIEMIALVPASLLLIVFSSWKIWKTK
ncbi:MAG: hypothetical protein ACFFCI_21545 [Promethearchaeota archaeon]